MTKSTTRHRILHAVTAAAAASAILQVTTYMRNWVNIPENGLTEEKRATVLNDVEAFDRLAMSIQKGQAALATFLTSWKVDPSTAPKTGDETTDYEIQDFLKSLFADDTADTDGAEFPRRDRSLAPADNVGADI